MAAGIVPLLIVLAIVQVMVFSLLVGRGRIKYGVPAPATTGHPTWERLYRVHLNSVEQAVVFIPLLLFYSGYVSSFGAVVLGTLYLVARTIYAIGYVRDPEKRFLGSLLTFLVQTVLAIGALIGIAVRVARS
jgi:uncharacterized membrane protein YecN with MAPEG domain